MADNEIKILFEYIDLLEAELKVSNPEQFQQLTQKRNQLFTVVRSLVDTLLAAHKSDQAEIKNLQEELFALRFGPKRRKAAPQDRPNARRK